MSEYSPRKKGAVAIAISGGVDSSTAALLLKEAGHDVVGVTMSLGITAADEVPAQRRDSRESEDARRVCRKLGIPHDVLDFDGELDAMVIRPFVSEYLRGRTPNPCVECNRAIKFGSLLRKVRAMGCEYLATGHYARVDHDRALSRLSIPRDAGKDQTYFLYAINKGDLHHVLFPLADYRKEEVRRLAAAARLPTSEKPDSQDICFVSKERMDSFIRQHAGKKILPGEIVNRAGKVLGRHRGLPFYTIGQRSGLGVSNPVPLYVLALDVAGNRLVGGEKCEVRATGLIADRINLLVNDPPERATAKIRYAHRAAPCSVTWAGENATIVFDKPQEAISPGQSVVVYDSSLVGGGGIIREAIR